MSIDVTPDNHPHGHVDALAVISFKLGCGCNIPPSTEPDEAFTLKGVGSTYPCRRHGEQIITRANATACRLEEVMSSERLPFHLELIQFLITVCGLIIIGRVLYDVGVAIFG